MANGNTRSPFGIYNAGENARNITAEARARIRGGEIDRPRHSNPVRETLQDFGSALTFGMIPERLTALEVENPILWKELQDDPQKMKIWESLSPELRDAVRRTRPGEMVGSRESFQRFQDAAYGKDYGFQGPGRSLVEKRPGGRAEITATTPFLVGPGQQPWAQHEGEGLAPVGEAQAFKPPAPQALSPWGKAYSQHRAGLYGEPGSPDALAELERELKSIESGKTTRVYQYEPGVEPSADERKKYGQLARETAGKLTSIGDVLQKVRSGSGKRFGFVGAAIAEGAPLIASVFPAIGNTLSKMATGVSLEQLANTRFAARALLAQSIEVVTGEEGARKTTWEQVETKKAGRILKLNASKEDIIGATQAILGITYVNWDRYRIMAGLPLEHDLKTRDGQDAQMFYLIKQGFSPETAGNITRMLGAQREYLEMSGAKPELKPLVLPGGMSVDVLGGPEGGR